MDQLAQERQRRDDLLFNWRINALSCDIISKYKLLQQHWLIKDPQLRNSMTNGIGPMGLVKNKMSFSLFPNERKYRLPDDYAPRSGAILKGAEVTENGILTFATAHRQVNVCNWSSG